MNWAVVAARILVGLMFVVFGLNGLLPTPFVPIPPPPEGTLARPFLLEALIPSGYLKAVKVLEVAGGVLLLAGRLPLVGLLILTPISLNILFYELFLLNAPGPGYVLVPLCLFLVWAYRSHVAPLFTVKPAVG
jgi:uncharacterized membrane protein YphA (DoxX/SURF4 family)